MNEYLDKTYAALWQRSPTLLQSFEQLEERIGYRFKRRNLLYEALTHRSLVLTEDAAGSRLPWNERLEFLGDAVLGLVISTQLIGREESFPEGDLSRIRASLVNEEALAGLANDIGLGASLLLGRGERRAGGAKRTSTLADALEALIGAIYEDQGFEAVKAVVSGLYESRLTGTLKPLLMRDYKTTLQEITQERFQSVPSYRVVREEGPDHAKEFVVEVEVLGKRMGAGSGISKKRAAQLAAKEAIVALRDEGPTSPVSEVR